MKFLKNIYQNFWNFSLWILKSNVEKYQRIKVKESPHSKLVRSNYIDDPILKIHSIFNFDYPFVLLRIHRARTFMFYA